MVPVCAAIRSPPNPRPRTCASLSRSKPTSAAQRCWSSPPSGPSGTPSCSTSSRTCTQGSRSREQIRGGEGRQGSRCCPAQDRQEGSGLSAFFPPSANRAGPSTADAASAAAPKLRPEPRSRLPSSLQLRTTAQSGRPAPSHLDALPSDSRLAQLAGAAHQLLQLLQQRRRQADACACRAAGAAPRRAVAQCVMWPEQASWPPPSMASPCRSPQQSKFSHA